MKLSITILFLSMFMIGAQCQPTSFSWFSDDDEKRFNYISPAKDQGEQGPCHIFAAVAAVEAMCHIYYSKPFPHGNDGTNLSEREIYSWCSGLGGPYNGPSVKSTLDFISANGIINESCFPYPVDTPYFTDCSTKCSTPQLVVDIPGYQQLTINTNQELKRAIIDYGPIAVSMVNAG
nr:C1 family peptidase [uncultured Draconibacterium sp.]